VIVLWNIAVLAHGFHPGERDQSQATDWPRWFSIFSSVRRRGASASLRFSGYPILTLWTPSSTIRFSANDGEPFCPHCGVAKVYTLAETPIRWKCAGCRKKFSVTSGNAFS
jgi:Transposase zinc-ribbon domain